MYINCLFYLTNVLMCAFCSYTDDIRRINFSLDYSDPDDRLWVPRVVNGYPAKLGDVPYQVALKWRYSKNVYATFCGASIVAPTKLISAAHCFEEKGSSCVKLFNPGRATPKSLEQKYAVAGNLINKARKGPDSTENGQWRRIHSVHYPKNYKFPKLDICVVYLKKPFKYNSYIGPIPMATKYIEYNGQCLVSGYGRTGNTKSSDRLMLANLDIMPTATCSQRHRREMKRFVCTSSVFTDVGKGDSGGPLVCSNSGDPNDAGKGILAGVVSGHRTGVGSFFTRVSRYQKFIARSKANTVYRNKINTVSYLTTFLIYISFLLL